MWERWKGTGDMWKEGERAGIWGDVGKGRLYGERILKWPSTDNTKDANHDHDEWAPP